MKKILIADDHWVVRHALKSILSTHPDLEIAGEASDGLQVLDFVDNKDIDLIVLDLSMPYLSGMQIMEALKTRKNAPPVLIFTMHPGDQYLKHIMKLGAKGFVSKDSEAMRIIDAVTMILSGKSSFPGNIDGQLTRRRLENRKLLEPLSRREDQVLRALVRGERNADIARSLNISTKTISTYRARILEKLNVNNNAELVALVAQYGVI